ncbi:MAG TPA: DUF4349 domain-containing protein [Kofleriaceae bacterium]|nr:DUF4349 domain-containing protein [Kofleriaceae bacterium]
MTLAEADRSYASNGPAGAPSAVAAGGGGGTTGVATGTSTPPSPQLQEQLVIEAWLGLEVDDVQEAAAKLRAEVDRVGGRITNEQLGGAGVSWSGSMSMRVPPGQAQGLFDFLAKLGTITSKRVQASDVSKQLFDQDLALENLGHTMDRLTKLLDKPGMEMKDVLAIETELTRLRGEIERIKGEQRWLKDRVAYATVEVALSRKAGEVPVILGAKAKFFPGARFAALTLLEPDGAKRTRLGGGITIMFPRANPADPVRGGFQFDAFQGPGDESAGFLATLGVATYSDFLGRGSRHFLNPYLGIRLGYAHINGSAFAFSGTAGLELYKHKYFMIDASVDLVGLVSDEFESAVVSGAGAVFAF